MSIRRLFGSALLLIGIVSFVVSSVLSLAARHESELFGSDVWLIWVVAACFAGAGFWLWRKGKQLRVLSADELLTRDTRPPVLYLRSFQADRPANTAMQETIAARVLPMSLPQNLATEEEQIAQVMNRIGPFVAIGRPGEHLPQLGAARMYATDDTWQGIVLDLLHRARLVLMRVGETTGFWWEVANASTLPDAKRIVFLLPSSSEHYERFRRRAEAHLPKPLPAVYNPKTMTDRSFGGVLWFESDWTPHVALCDSKLDTARYSVAADLREKLAAVLDPLDDDKSVLAPPGRRIAAAALDAVVFAGIALLYYCTVEYAHQASALTEAVVPALGFFIYFGVLEASTLRATPGKKALSLVTVDKTGVRLALLPSLLRASIKFFEVASWLWVVSIALLFAGKRPFHDYFTRSTVIFRCSKTIYQRAAPQ